jgi:hypothetical protein
MKLKIALLVAGIALAPMASFANDDYYETDDIHGRSIFALTAALADKGIDAERVEEWGGAIRVFVRDANGSSSMVLVNKDTLQPINQANAVGSRIDTGRDTGSGWNASNFNDSLESLTE